MTFFQQRPKEFSMENRTIVWIEALAEQDVAVQRGERSSLDISLAQRAIVAVETTQFLTTLRQQFSILLSCFNRRAGSEGAGSNGHDIRLFKNGEDMQGFSLVRGPIKMAVSCMGAGGIQIQCEKMAQDPGVNAGVIFSGLIEARVGVFHDVEWCFLGNRIYPHQVAQHYLTEFLQTR